MCLKLNKDSEKIIATEDIVVYKRLSVTERGSNYYVGTFDGMKSIASDTLKHVEILTKYVW